MTYREMNIWMLLTSDRYGPAINRILSAYPDGRYLRVRPNKMPVGQNWTDGESYDLLRAHIENRNGPIGVIPGSMGYVMFDLDLNLSATYDALQKALGEPSCVTDSLKGMHCWYPTEDFLDRCGRLYLDDLRVGDITCLNGYVTLWRPDQFAPQDRTPLTAESLKRIEQRTREYHLTSTQEAPEIRERQWDGTSGTPA